MEIEDIKKLGLKIDGDIFFDQSIKNLGTLEIAPHTLPLIIKTLLSPLEIFFKNF